MWHLVGEVCLVPAPIWVILVFTEVILHFFPLIFFFFWGGEKWTTVCLHDGNGSLSPEPYPQMLDESEQLSQSQTLDTGAMTFSKIALSIMAHCKTHQNDSGTVFIFFVTYEWAQ